MKNKSESSISLWDNVNTKEEKKSRRCLAQKSVSCAKEVYGYRSDRICPKCAYTLRVAKLI